MPTWANHFRIADKLLPHLKTLNTKYFIIGNIAPDCGIPDKAPGVYNPPTGETHFTKDYYYSKKTDCDYNYIYSTFIKGESDIKKRSFFIGYYAHLLADCRYANELFLPIEKAHGDFRKNEELRNTVRTERNNIDFLFFKENTSPSFELFKGYDGWNEAYPKWYKNGEITRQMKNIVKHYTNGKPSEMSYRYLTPQIMSDFADRVSGIILEDMKSKGIIK
jgi:hypothetical protein